MNKDIETKCSSIIYPNRFTQRADGTYTVLVYTDAAKGDQGYITVEDVITLAKDAFIHIVDIDSTGVAGQYGRSVVTYKVW